MAGPKRGEPRTRVLLQRKAPEPHDLFYLLQFSESSGEHGWVDNGGEASEYAEIFGLARVSQPLEDF